MATKYLLERDFYGKHGTHYAPDPNGVYLPDYEVPPSSARKVADSFRGVAANIKLSAKVSPFGIQGPSDDDKPVKPDTQAEAKAQAGVIDDDGAGAAPDPAKVAEESAGKDYDGDSDKDEMAKLLAARNRAPKDDAPEQPKKRGSKK